eukprot:354698-Chlamydomonas_euryale.AAC.7
MSCQAVHAPTLTCEAASWASNARRDRPARPLPGKATRAPAGSISPAWLGASAGPRAPPRVPPCCRSCSLRQRPAGRRKEEQVGCGMARAATTKKVESEVENKSYGERTQHGQGSSAHDKLPSKKSRTHTAAMNITLAGT